MTEPGALVEPGDRVAFVADHRPESEQYAGLLGTVGLAATDGHCIVNFDDGQRISCGRGNLRVLLDLDTTIAFFGTLVGRVVEARIDVPAGSGRRPLATFSGVLDGVDPGDSPLFGPAWRLHWREDGAPKPAASHIVITADDFDGGYSESETTIGQVEEYATGRREPDEGVVWTFTVLLLGGTRIMLDVYL